MFVIDTNNSIQERYFQVVCYRKESPNLFTELMSFDDFFSKKNVLSRAILE